MRVRIKENPPAQTVYNGMKKYLGKVIEVEEFGNFYFGPPNDRWYWFKPSVDVIDATVLPFSREMTITISDEEIEIDRKITVKYSLIEENCSDIPSIPLQFEDLVVTMDGVKIHLPEELNDAIENKLVELHKLEKEC